MRRVLALVMTLAILVPAAPVAAAGSLAQSDVTALVSALPTTVALGSAPNPSVVGTAPTLTATVSPATATGTVTFTDVTGGGAATLGTAPLVNGVATLAPTFAAIGQRQLTAAYGGSGTYDPSTSPVLVHKVRAETLTPTTTVLQIAPNPVAAGSATTLTATVSPAPTVGVVEWLVDSSVVDATPVGVGGVATTNRTFPDPGSHSIQARYVEGTLYADSQSTSATLTVAAVAYTVTLTAVPPIVAGGSATHLSATISPATAGTVKFYAGTSLAGTTAIAAGGTATLDPVVPMGTSLYHADFIPTGGTLVAGTSTVVAVDGKQGTWVALSADLADVVSGEGLVTFTATLGDYDASGGVSFWDVTGTPTNLGTADVATDDIGDAVAILQARLYGVGLHAVEARYGGDPTYAPATSGAVGIEVTPDIGVTATAGVQYATFYPYKDSYRDTVALQGDPGEPIKTLSVKVYNGAGKLVRSWGYSSLSTAWALPWNGKTVSGVRQPAGKYRVVQTLTDYTGHTRKITSYTTISNKRLYWYTASQTKKASSTSDYQYSDYGDVYLSSRYSGGVTLYGDTYPDWAWAGYAFTLPAAAKYGTLTFAALGSPKTGYGVPYLSLWNYDLDQEDGARWVGRSYAWYSTSVSSTGHITTGRRVWAYATAMGSSYGWYDIAKVRLTYRYALLK